MSNNHSDIKDNIVFALMGPTASGKTELAMAAVQRFPLEIISVDSAQIYRDMDIGTAKPSADELRLAPHHLIDIVDPADNYSCAQFCEDALGLIRQIQDRGKIPFLVGGTMLYFNGLINGLSRLPQSDPGLRKQLEEEGEKLGWDHMHQRLHRVDPESAKRIHPNDPQRILRALEVHLQSGMSLSEQWRLNRPKPFAYPLKTMVLLPEDRDYYKQVIAGRFREMLRRGFVDEVKSLIQRGDLTSTMASMRCVGYRQIWAYLHGDFDQSEMEERGIFATRQLGKRQLTWLRKLQNDYKLPAYDAENTQKLLNLLDSHLN